MSAIEILAVVGLICLIVFRQLQGEPLRGRRTVLLPAILTVIGYADLHKEAAHIGGADLACLIVGVAGSVVIGLGFGAVTRLQERDGFLWAQLPKYGLWLWGALFAWRGLDLFIASAMHAHVAASSSTLLFSLGVNRLAQAAVILPRALRLGVPFAPEKDGSSFLSGTVGRPRD